MTLPDLLQETLVVFYIWNITDCPKEARRKDIDFQPLTYSFLNGRQCCKCFIVSLKSFCAGRRDALAIRSLIYRIFSQNSSLSFAAEHAIDTEKSAHRVPDCIGLFPHSYTLNVVLPQSSPLSSFG